MLTFLRMLCCLPCHSQFSATKRSNLGTLREVLMYLYNLDDSEHQVVNSFIRDILAELSETNDRMNRTDDYKSSLPLVNKASLVTLCKNLRDRTNSSQHSVCEPAINNDSQRFVGWRYIINGHHRSSVAPACSSNRTQIHHLDPLSQFTPNQLELLLRLEAVKHWVHYTALSNLGSDALINLPALLPRPCSVSEPGRLRIASWNLNRFTLAKARHPGFCEAVCLIILRAQLSLVVLQEVTSLDVANVLCSELNSPTLPHVRQWVLHHPSSCFSQWDVATSIQATGTLFRGKEYAVFIYNKHSGVQVRRTSLLEPQNALRTDKLFSRSPCYALCQFRSFRVVFVSVHLKARGLRNSMVERTAAEVEILETLVQAFYDTQPGGSFMIIAGDFNLHPGHEAFSGLKKQGFWPTLGDSQSTTTSSSDRPHFEERPSSSATSYDNAWLSPSFARSDYPHFSDSPTYTGDAGVIYNDLRHPLIPDDTGAGANGFVSDHCPIWFDLYVP